MSEFIVTLDLENTDIEGSIPIVNTEPIVRCRDCKYGIDGGKYCAEGCADSWDWRIVEPDGFCKWGERRDA